jgi:outer membrane protein TolC
MKRVINLLLLVCSFGYAQVLDEEILLEYLNESNPNIYALVGKNYVESEKVTYALGAFDISTDAKYENKEYPNSKADYKDIYLSKTFENALEVRAGYRDAYGTQEYNNIKTGDDGEFVASVKIPLLELAKSVNAKEYDLKKARYNLKQTELGSVKSVNDFKLITLQKYYETLYLDEVVELYREILQNAKKREEFVEQKIEQGALGRVEALEAKEQTLSYKQNFQSAKNSLNIAVEELCFYMHLPSEEFHQKYELPRLKNSLTQEHDLESSIQEALQKRAEIEAIRNSHKILNLDQKYFSLLAYPKTNLTMYGIYDPIYKEGYKVTLTFDFALEQTKYEAKQKETLESLKYASELMQNKQNSIETKIRTLLLEAKTLSENLKNSQEQLKILQELESVEAKRYEMGLGNLFMVNQRELKTLEIKIKILALKLKSISIEKAIQREKGV